MSTQPPPYTKDELLHLAGDALPTRGELCPKCRAVIPQFTDLTDQETGRIRYLILEGRTLMAMHELRSSSLCPMAWARLWVEHASHILDAQPGAAKISYRQRELWVCEDDFCQAGLLPREATAYAEAEIKKRREFAEARRTSGAFSRSAVYVPASAQVEVVKMIDGTVYLRREAPVDELRTLKIKKKLLNEIVSPFLQPFDVVYTGYSFPRERCRNTWAWGRSVRCALLADWDDEGIIASIDAEFFDQDETSILAATHAVAALGNLHPLVYVDFAWGYTCDASDKDAFASLLRTKLKTIEDRMKSSTKD